MNKQRWIIFSLFTLGALALLVVVSGGSKVNVDAVDVNKIQTASSSNGNIGDHIYGKTGSKVTLIEYGDFQCPPCGNMYPIVKQLTAKYKDQLQYVFRNFPITTSHPNARAAAATAEAAGLQGKYWEMHDKIYEKQSDWSELDANARTTFFEGLAKDIGLDVSKFNSDVVKTSLNDKVDFDYQLGKKAGVEGTPTFFLDGAKLDPSAYGDSSKFDNTIKTALKKANIALPQ